MRVYIQMFLGDGRLADDIGADYPDFETARNEAVTSAREFFGEELRHGRPVSADASIEILNENRAIVDYLTIEQIMFGMDPSLRYRQVYDSVPHPYLLLAPDFVILEANRAYLGATMTELGQIARQPMFDIFPDNPGDPSADGVRNLTVSFNRVLDTKLADNMALQRYDMRRPNGSWEERYWKSLNLPVLDDNGDVKFIIHSAADVTRNVLGKAARD